MAKRGGGLNPRAVRQVSFGSIVGMFFYFPLSTFHFTFLFVEEDGMGEETGREGRVWKWKLIWELQG